MSDSRILPFVAFGPELMPAGNAGIAIMRFPKRLCHSAAGRAKPTQVGLIAASAIIICRRRGVRTAPPARQVAPAKQEQQGERGDRGDAADCNGDQYARLHTSSLWQLAYLIGSHPPARPAFWAADLHQLGRSRHAFRLP